MGSGDRDHAHRGPGPDRSSRSGCSFLSSTLRYIRPVHRNVTSRAFSAVLSLWLALCLVEPTQLHTCEMHGGLAIQQSGGGLGHTHSAARHRTATHFTGHSQHDQGGDSQSQQCSCLGDCNGGSAPVGLVAATISLSASIDTDRSSAKVEYESPALVSAHFLLPYANGPPLSSSRA
jgi:hypothetical protein